MEARRQVSSDIAIQLTLLAASAKSLIVAAMIPNGSK